MKLPTEERFIEHKGLGINLDTVSTYELKKDDMGEIVLAIWTIGDEEPIMVRGERMEKILLILHYNSWRLGNMSIDEIKEYLK